MMGGLKIVLGEPNLMCHKEFALCDAWMIDPKIALVPLASRFNTAPNSSIPDQSSPCLMAPDLRPFCCLAFYIDDHGTGLWNNQHKLLQIPPTTNLILLSIFCTDTTMKIKRALSEFINKRNIFYAVVYIHKIWEIDITEQPISPMPKDSFNNITSPIIKNCI